MKPFAAVLVIVALVFGCAILFRSGSGAHPTQAQMESVLVCTTCHEPLDESVSPLAQQMKAEIARQIAAGWSASRIENYFVAELGPQALGVPRSSGFDLLAWLLPFGAIVFGAGGVGVGARAWLRNRDETDATASPPSSERSMPANLELRVDQELARFDD